MSRLDLVRKLDELRSEIERLEGEIKKLQRERKDTAEEIGLSEQIVGLKKRISELQINEAKIKEEHARDKREVEHMVGLERKRQEFEMDASKREATLTVREENLAADRKRFEEQMEFTHKRFAEEVGYLKELMEQILLRLPSIELNGKLTVHDGKRTPARRS